MPQHLELTTEYPLHRSALGAVGDSERGAVGDSPAHAANDTRAKIGRRHSSTG